MDKFHKKRIYMLEPIVLKEKTKENYSLLTSLSFFSHKLWELKQGCVVFQICSFVNKIITGTCQYIVKWKKRNVPRGGLNLFLLQKSPYHLLWKLPPDKTITHCTQKIKLVTLIIHFWLICLNGPSIWKWFDLDHRNSIESSWKWMWILNNFNV